MKKFFKAFRDFAIKGNMFDMAVGIMVGGAFTALTSSLIGNIISPLVGFFQLGGFAGLSVTIGSAEIAYGQFLTDLVNFLVLAFVIFLMVKGVNRVRAIGAKQEEKKDAVPPAPSQEEKLLTEIRDLLREKKD